MSASKLRVLLVGATGLVGRCCLAQLRSDARVASIALLQRRAEEPDQDSRVTLVQTDFEQLGELPDTVFAVDAVLCALGSTIRQAGSEAAFRHIDHDYAVTVAQRARAAGAGAFGLVSAVGADAGSRVFYNRVKGETEDDIAALGFRSLTLLRPSLLLGVRVEYRFAERMFAPFGSWLPARWRAVPATRVAEALVGATLLATPGTRIIENADLF